MCVSQNSQQCNDGIQCECRQLYVYHVLRCRCSGSKVALIAYVDELRAELFKDGSQLDNKLNTWHFRVRFGSEESALGSSTSRRCPCTEERAQRSICLDALHNTQGLVPFGATNTISSFEYAPRPPPTQARGQTTYFCKSLSLHLHAQNTRAPLATINSDRLGLSLHHVRLNTSKFEPRSSLMWPSL